ncbi:MAG: sulfatase-like hydrolase/transferase [Clostridia bacterium]|nr:sulfatase-like hydrolase/transferase [Clostridia bacterium]
MGFGIADKAFFDMTTDYMKEQEGKYFDFIISLSSHTPYNTNSSMSEIRLKASDRGTTYGNYLIAINYLDSAIGEFIQELKDKGLYDNSIIVFYGDHHGLHKSDADSAKFMSNFLGYPYGFDDMENIPLIVHIPGLGRSEEIKTTCGQMDIAPTILNLMGIENTALHFGEDILSLPEDSDRPIGGNTYMQAGSFINKDYVFIMSKDSIYENSTIIDRKTKGIASNLVSKDSIYDMSK